MIIRYNDRDWGSEAAQFIGKIAFEPTDDLDKFLFEYAGKKIKKEIQTAYGENFKLEKFLNIVEICDLLNSRHHSFSVSLRYRYFPFAADSQSGEDQTRYYYVDCLSGENFNSVWLKRISSEDGSNNLIKISNSLTEFIDLLGLQSYEKARVSTESGVNLHVNSYDIRNIAYSLQIASGHSYGVKRIKLILEAHEQYTVTYGDRYNYESFSREKFAKLLNKEDRNLVLDQIVNEDIEHVCCGGYEVKKKENREHSNKGSSILDL